MIEEKELPPLRTEDGKRLPYVTTLLGANLYVDGDERLAFETSALLLALTNGWHDRTVGSQEDE